MMYRSYEVFRERNYDVNFYNKNDDDVPTYTDVAKARPLYGYKDCFC